MRGKTTLLDTAQRWIAAGDKLGKLEREREAQEAKELTQPLGKAGVNALRARWIRHDSIARFRMPLVGSLECYAENRCTT